MRLPRLTLIAAALIAALIIFLPLRWALALSGVERTGFSAFHVSGSVWDGHIRQARLGNIDLGDVDAALDPLALLTAQLAVRLSRPAGNAQPPLSLTLLPGGGNLGFRDGNGTLSLGAQLAPLPAAQLNLRDAQVRFTGGRCRSASGQLQLSVQGGLPGFDWGPGLSGALGCDDGAARALLRSANGAQEMAVRLTGDGRYDARLKLIGDTPSAALLLPALGFRRLDNGYVLQLGAGKASKGE
jgi:general secretion pathway protein N